MKPIYKPKGAAAEYSEFALNIYTGCPHGCFYCYCPNVIHKDRERFHEIVEQRTDIVEATKRQIEREGITGKTIHLCFVGDPYPYKHDSSVTREIIGILKHYGNHVQILTKNGHDAKRDFDLLDSDDWFGITWAGYEDADFMNDMSPSTEPGAGTLIGRLLALQYATIRGIKTWISFEPVLNAKSVLDMIEVCDYVDLIKIGKLNYHPSSIDWKKFGYDVEALCKKLGRNYYIKDSLRKEMEK